MVITGAEWDHIRGLSTRDLQRRYREVFGEAPLNANRRWLIKRVAWGMQAKAEGGLSERFRERAAAIAAEASLRVLPPRVKGAAAVVPVPLPAVASDPRLPIPGTVLRRAYKGRTLLVKVLADGFEYEGAVFASLSAVAKAITGSHTNGYLFFHLTGGSR